MEIEKLESFKIDHFNKAILEFKFLKNDWLVKRTLLHILWAFINITTLIFVYSLVSNTKWTPVFIVGCLLYCLFYWLLSSIMFDKLIGDEIDHLK